VKRLTLLGVPVLLLVPLAGCGQATTTAPPTPASASTSSSTSASTSTPAKAPPPTPEEVVADPKASIYDVSVVPGPRGDTVRVWWTLHRGHRDYGAIVTSRDGMRTATYERATDRAWEGPHPIDGKALIPQQFRWVDLGPTVSLDPHVRALTGGGDDGIFSEAVKSVDGGAWQVAKVRQVDGQWPGTTGQLVLPDGRLLVLAAAWTGDRSGRHPYVSPLPRGLMVSDGSDWTSFTPYRPTFTPALPPAAEHMTALYALGAGAESGGFTGTEPVWTWTDDNRLYVSTDDVATFEQIPARPQP
jgi:hypothetical protein